MSGVMALESTWQDFWGSLLAFAWTKPGPDHHYELFYQQEGSLLVGVMLTASKAQGQLLVWTNGCFEMLLSKHSFSLWSTGWTWDSLPLLSRFKAACDLSVNSAGFFLRLRVDWPLLCKHKDKSIIRSFQTRLGPGPKRSFPAFIVAHKEGWVLGPCVWEEREQTQLWVYLDGPVSQGVLQFIRQRKSTSWRFCLWFLLCPGG